MGCIGRELAHLGKRGVEAADHVIDRGSEAPDFIIDGPDRDGLIEVLCCDRSCGAW